MEHKQTISTKKIVLAALMAALTIVGSAIRITMPIDIAGTTSFHLGNIMCALSGILVFGIQHLIQNLRLNGILQNLLVSAFTALVVVMMVRIGIGNTPAKITIGNIMLLIPGVAFTTSLRDIINGDTIAGLVGLSEAVLKAIAIAIGFAAVLVGIGGIL